MRTTIKKQNELLDYVKINSRLKSRAEASVYLYSVIGKRFKALGYTLSHYKDNRFTLTKDDLKYHRITPSALYTPSATVSFLESNQTDVMEGDLYTLAD